MWIEFSKAWGQNDCRWNYCGGDWNFDSMIDFMNFYGIREAKIIGKTSYYKDDNDDKEIECYEYSGFARKHYEILLKHWRVDYCKSCNSISVSQY